MIINKDIEQSPNNEFQENQNKDIEQGPDNEFQENQNIDIEQSPNNEFQENLNKDIEQGPNNEFQENQNIDNILNSIINDVENNNKINKKRGRKSKKDIEREEIEKEKRIKIELLSQIEIINLFIGKFTKKLDNYEIKSLVDSIYKVLKKHNIESFSGIPFYEEIQLVATIGMIILVRK